MQPTSLMLSPSTPPHALRTPRPEAGQSQQPRGWHSSGSSKEGKRLRGDDSQCDEEPSWKKHRGSIYKKEWGSSDSSAGVSKRCRGDDSTHDEEPSRKKYHGDLGRLWKEEWDVRAHPEAMVKSAACIRNGIHTEYFTDYVDVKQAKCRQSCCSKGCRGPIEVGDMRVRSSLDQRCQRWFQ